MDHIDTWLDGLLPMHRPVMSVVGNSTIHSQCRQDSDTRASPPRSLRKAISIPAVSSLVKDSWTWAGDTIHTYRDGLTTEQRRQRAQIEDRKQVLYLKIKHVSSPAGT